MRGPKTMRWQVLVLVIPALAAIAVAVAKYLGLSKFQMLIVGILALLLPVLAKIASHWAQTTFESRRQIKKLAPGSKRGRLPKARDIDIPHSPRLHAAAKQQVPYISRDADPDIESRLKHSNKVLIVGNSMTGKTRSLLEVMGRLYPSFAVWIPSDPDQLRTAVTEGFEPRKTAILLDDLERFAKDGITEVLESLVEENVILASIRSSDYDRLQPYGDIKPIGWDICSWLGEPVWFVDWSPAEIDRARDHVPEEHHKALARDGLSAFVGGARILSNRLNALRTKNGAAYAMVQFARDWHAFSASSGFSPYVFEAMRDHYPHSGEYHRESVIDELLTSIFSDVSLAQMDGSRLIFTDYIDEVIAPTANTRSADYWERVIDVADDRDRVNIGAFLMRTGEQVELAKNSFSRSKEALAAVNLAGIYTDFEPFDLDSAESLLRPHASTVPEAAFDLAVLLERRLGGPHGLNIESRKLYEFAATKEFAALPPAQFNVANYILNDEDPDLKRAEHLLRQAMGSGHARAAAALGRILIEDGRVEEGLEVLESVLEADIDRSASLYAMTLVHVQPDRAEEVARNHCTRLDLANVLISLGGASRAREVLEILSIPATDRESDEDVVGLRVIALLALGECTPEDADEAMRLSWDSKNNLGRLGFELLNGRFETPGLRAMRRSFELGDSGSGVILAEYYRSVAGDLDSAEEWYRRSVDEARPSTLVGYANFVYEHRGDYETARELWSRALSLQCVDQKEKQFVESIARGNLGLLLSEIGDLDGSEEFLREAVKYGRPQAMLNLSTLLRRRGGARNRMEALYWKRRARSRGRDPHLKPQTFAPDPEIRLPVYVDRSEVIVIRENGMVTLAVPTPLEQDDQGSA